MLLCCCFYQSVEFNSFGCIFSISPSRSFAALFFTKYIENLCLSSNARKIILFDNPFLVYLQIFAQYWREYLPFKQTRDKLGAKMYVILFWFFFLSFYSNRVCSSIYLDTDYFCTNTYSLMPCDSYHDAFPTNSYILNNAFQLRFSSTYENGWHGKSGKLITGLNNIWYDSVFLVYRYTYVHSISVPFSLVIFTFFLLSLSPSHPLVQKDHYTQCSKQTRVQLFQFVAVCWWIGGKVIRCVY